MIVIVVFCYGLPMVLLKKCLFQSEFCPIRFNRKTKQIYIYEHDVSPKKLLLWPWELIRIKPPVIKVYGWHQIEAILTRNTMISGYGASTSFNVQCLALEPGTLNVIDSFILCHDVSYDEGANCWQWVSAFMHNQQALDLSVKNAKPSLLSLLHKRIAPLPMWPEAIDKMSKANSVVELYNLQQEYGSK